MSLVHVLISVFLMLIAIGICCWIIQLIPFPETTPPKLVQTFRALLYILVGLLALLYILDLAGWYDFGIHKRWK